MEMQGVEHSSTTTVSEATQKDRLYVLTSNCTIVLQTNLLSPVAVNKPIPYTFDLGNLTCFDENIVPTQPTNEDIAAISRDCAQALINQLLTTCQITHNSADGTLITLPPATTSLPREKPLPTDKPETKWERFARKKGIKKNKDGKMIYDEEKGDWVPKWGYKGKNKADEDQWIMEVDEKKEQELKDGETIRGSNRRERVENIKRNERKQRANERNARKNGS
jgi:regulator of ribosome biosynthesis